MTAGSENGPGWFEDTQWSVIAKAQTAADTAAFRALDHLCRTYWPPLFSYVCWKGFSPEEAKDLTQEFFARFLERQDLRSVSREKGRFRCYLLSALQNFLSNERDRARTLKRGGQFNFISLEGAMEAGFEPGDRSQDADLEKRFDQQWATTLLRTTLGRLRAEYEAAGKGEQFELLKPALAGTEGFDEEAVAQKLRIQTGSVPVLLHRLRRRYRELIRREVAQTVATRNEVEEELHYLFEVLSR